MLYKGENSAFLGRVLLAGMWLRWPPQRGHDSEGTRRGAGVLSVASPLWMRGKQAGGGAAGSAAVPGGCVTGRDLIAVSCAGFTCINPFPQAPPRRSQCHPA